MYTADQIEEIIDEVMNICHFKDACPVEGGVCTLIKVFGFIQVMIIMLVQRIYTYRYIFLLHYIELIVCL